MGFYAAHPLINPDRKRKASIGVMKSDDEPLKTDQE